MVYGTINRKGEVYYTDLNRVLQAIGYRHKDYNWLITDCVCYPQNPAIAEMLAQDYCWLSGEQLSDLVMAENFSLSSSRMRILPKTMTLRKRVVYSSGTT